MWQRKRAWENILRGKVSPSRDIEFIYASTVHCHSIPIKDAPRVTVNITPVTVIIITTPEIVGGAKRDSLPASSSVDSTLSLDSEWVASE